MLQLLLKVNQILEVTLRREEALLRWNTVRFLWGAGELWPGRQHRPGRTAVLSLGPSGRLRGSSSISSLRLPDGSNARDFLGLVDASACTLEVLEGGLQFTVVAYQDEARGALNKGSSSLLKSLGFFCGRPW